MEPEEQQDVCVSPLGPVAFPYSGHQERNTCASLSRKGVIWYSHMLASSSVLLESGHIFKWSGLGGPCLNHYNPIIKILMTSLDESKSCRQLLCSSWIEYPQLKPLQLTDLNKCQPQANVSCFVIQQTGPSVLISASGIQLSQVWRGPN